MKQFLLIVLCFLLVQVANAQDVIVKVNGEELKAKVLEITLAAVIYQAPDSAAGKNDSIARKEVFMVRFANGSKEVFQENLPIIKEEPVALDPAQMFRLGEQDALRYYKGNGAMWGSAASVFVVGPLGAIVIGAVKPPVQLNEGVDYAMLQDVNYVNGYRKQAHKRKIGKSALGVGIGTAAMMMFILGTVGGK